MPPSPRALAALASLLRGCLVVQLIARQGRNGIALGAADHETAIVGPSAAPFAPSSYARARLLRQLHASGLLCQPATRRPESSPDLLETAG